MRSFENVCHNVRLHSTSWDLSLWCRLTIVPERGSSVSLCSVPPCADAARKGILGNRGLVECDKRLLIGQSRYVCWARGVFKGDAYKPLCSCFQSAAGGSWHRAEDMWLWNGLWYSDLHDQQQGQCSLDGSRGVWRWAVCFSTISLVGYTNKLNS